jgi:hypothetical protein
MVGDFISESGAISFRNRGRLNIGMVGDFARNHHHGLPTPIKDSP